MPDQRNQPPAGTDIKSREKQQGLKKHKKPNQVEERPGSRTRGQEEGNKNQPTPTPDPKSGNL